jgi:hypothetical protein
MLQFYGPGINFYNNLYANIDCNLSNVHLSSECMRANLKALIFSKFYNGDFHYNLLWRQNFQTLYHICKKYLCQSFQDSCKVALHDTFILWLSNFRCVVHVA